MNKFFVLEREIAYSSSEYTKHIPNSGRCLLNKVQQMKSNAPYSVAQKSRKALRHVFKPEILDPVIFKLTAVTLA